MRKAIEVVVLMGIFGIAVAFSSDSFDMFRLPKTLLLYAQAMLIAGLALAALLFGVPLPRPDWRDPAVAVPLAAFAVMLAVTLTSTHVALSLQALATAAATLIVFFATVFVARDRGLIFVAVPLAAAAANALLVIAQETHLWMPFGVRAGIPYHLQCTALVGNPNEVGGYLGAAAIAALALVSQRATLLNVSAAALLIAGLVASRTLTALVAFAAAAVIVFALTSWKRVIRIAAYVAVAGAIVVTLVAPLRARAANMVQWVRSGDYNALLTDRVTPFVAASLLFADHPVAGAGPGTFGWHYYDYKLRAEERYPSLREAYNRGINFGEVHNDHLQVLAEGGVIGYLAFLAVLIALGSISLRGERANFARRLALPLAVFWVVLSLAQFPLETTVVRSLLVHFAALCVAWRSA